MHPLKARITYWVVAAVVLIAGATIILRHVGVPMPETLHTTTIQGRLHALAGRAFGWRESLRYPNGQMKARVFCRGAYLHQSLIDGKYYDPEGNLRSRVIDGNGFAIIFHDNGTPRALIGYHKGVESGPHIEWDAEGQLLRTEHRDRKAIK